MANLDMTATPESVWAILQEVGRKNEETAALLKAESLKTEKIFQEVGRKQEENAAQMKAMFEKRDKEFEKRNQELDKLSKNIGGLNNDLGDFAEGLLATNLLKKFLAFGLDFDATLHDVEICERGTHRVLAEIDWLLLNSTIALVGEVKAHLGKGDVDNHLQRLKKLPSIPNGLLKGKKLYGAVAGVTIRDKTREYARKKGLFVLEPSGDAVTVEAPLGAPAVW
jgi:hypothetical protein